MTRMKVKPHEPASGGRKRLPGLPRICRDVLTYVAAFPFLASVRCFGADEPPLPPLPRLEFVLARPWEVLPERKWRRLGERAWALTPYSAERSRMA